MIDDNTSVQSRMMTAFFDTRAAADKASHDLVAVGIPRQQITIKEGASLTSASEGLTAGHDKGFWEELKDLFISDEDRHGYAEGLRRGGYLLAVNVDEANYSRALDILDADGSIDMDEREATWRTEGWGGGATAVSEAHAGISTASSALAATGSVSSTGAKVDTVAAGRDEVIPLYEETAQVAKRDVNLGRVRLRSYVVETPISEQVNLRKETVQVERRPVDRPIAVSDAVFQDRVIEAEEHTEEAFVTKEARVTGEVSLRKTVEDRAQTVTGSVRRTEVEVEDGRAGRDGGAVAFADTSRIEAHMDVIASDGSKVGTVDHLDGLDKIKLAKNTSPDGEHHYLPISWVDHVDAHVHLTKSMAEVHAGW